MRRNLRIFLTASAVLLAVPLALSCGPVAGQGDEGDGHVGECEPGTIECDGLTARTCGPNGTWSEEACESACVRGQGCVACVEGSYYCEDNWVVVCNSEQEFVRDHQCAEDEACIMGMCVDRCHPDALHPSNVGCEFWAVDLDNEAVDNMGMSNDAAAQLFAVAIANNNDFAVQVRVTINTARVGQPVVEQEVTNVSVPAGDLLRIDLPQREVDGCMGQNDTYVKYSGSGTFVSPHAFKIVASGPVVAYQFNPVVQQFSNDASILIPIQALGKHHYVMGYPTANPCGASEFQQPSIPDHTSVTILGIHENTEVTVTPTHAITASDGDTGFTIAETQPGEILEFTVGPYDVVNLESYQPTASLQECISLAAQYSGDFSGTKVVSTREVAVFSSHERGLAGGEAPKPPDWDGESCCTDHLEQQMLPTTAQGWNYVISRSPVRSTGSWREYDVYRVMAMDDNTLVETSLAEFPEFNLNAGEFATFWAQAGFTVESQGGAIMIGQYLVSQGYTDGGNGDSTFTIFPPAEQHREEYVFLILDTFTDNYMVLAMPDSAGISIDGQPLGEFPLGCSVEVIGPLGGENYSQMTCRLDPGVHTVEASEPVGLTVYGYYNVGSYGYPGGADVRIINPVE